MKVSSGRLFLDFSVPGNEVVKYGLVTILFIASQAGQKKCRKLTQDRYVRHFLHLQNYNLGALTFLRLAMVA